METHYLRGLRPRAFLCLFGPMDGLIGRPIEGPAPFCVVAVEPTRALGLSGDNIVPGRGVVMAVVGWPMPTPVPSVTFLRIPGRPDAGPIDPAEDDVAPAPNPFTPRPPKLLVNVSPRLCLRDFSCLVCTTRKWESNSVHLMCSSRLSLDRIVEVEGWIGTLNGMG